MAGDDDRIVRDAEGGYWQRRPGGARAALGVTVVGLAAASVVQYGGFVTRGSVQDDLSARATAALEENGWPGLTVTASGRDLTVSGPADPESVPRILALVQAQTGVRVAVFAGAGGSGGVAQGTPSATVTPTDLPSSATPTGAPTATPTGAPSSAATTTPTDATATATPTDSTTATPTTTPTVSPSTPAPAPTKPNPIVNATGGSTEAQAAAAAIAQLPKIQFPSAISGPTDAGRVTVGKIAAILLKYPSVTAKIEGHTDDLGTARINLELSAARADVVRTLLIRAGVKGSRLTAKGYGESRPFVPNTSDANRAVNRRVSFTLS